MSNLDKPEPYGDGYDTGSGNGSGNGYGDGSGEGQRLFKKNRLIQAVSLLLVLLDS